MNKLLFVFDIEKGSAHLVCKTALDEYLFNKLTFVHSEYTSSFDEFFNLLRQTIFVDDDLFNVNYGYNAVEHSIDFNTGEINYTIKFLDTVPVKVTVDQMDRLSQAFLQYVKGIEDQYLN